MVPPGCRDDDTMPRQGDAISLQDISVLHVIESLGGGVLTAVRDYMLSTPEIQHLVLGRERVADLTGETFDGLAESVGLAPTNLLSATRAVGRAYRQYRPDIVHAHSSFAGVWARLARIPPARIVYTPHCYAFERQDINRMARLSYREAERILARRTGFVIGVSPRELALAKRLNRRQPASYVPNVARVPEPAAAGGSQREDRSLIVVGAGRLCHQKDPSFFRAVAGHLRELAPEIRLRWLGGGDPGDEHMLRSEGVDVTGWIERGEVLREMSTADVYLHTAAWEGAPITLLEAAASGLPVVARRIPALESLDLPRLERTPAGVARRIIALREPTNYSDARAEALALHDRHHPRHQRARLLSAYRGVARRTEPH